MFMSFQSLPTLKAFCPFCSCPGVNNFLLSFLLIVFALCPSFNGLALGRGTRDSKGAHVFCFLSSLPLYVWVLPVISLLLISTVSPVRACIIIRWERFRGTQIRRRSYASQHSILSGGQSGAVCPFASHLANSKACSTPTSPHPETEHGIHSILFNNICRHKV